MGYDILKYRPDFEAAKNLLARIQTYVDALAKLDKSWSNIKNREASDFRKIYSFKQDEKAILEWFYNEGRQLAHDLLWNLELWTQPEKTPTFKSFVDYMEHNWVHHLPDVKLEFEEKEKLAKEISGAPYAVIPMSLQTFRDVLRIFDGIEVWINMAKNNDLYKMETGEDSQQKPVSDGGLHIHGNVGNIGNVVGESNESTISTKQGVVTSTGQKKGGGGLFGKFVGLIKGLFS